MHDLWHFVKQLFIFHLIHIHSLSYIEGKKYILWWILGKPAQNTRQKAILVLKEQVVMHF